MNQMLYDMNKYLKFEYWNECDLGNIYYQGGQKFMFYLDADVGEPLHEDIEEGQENGDGDFIPTYRRQMKRYRIRTGLIPDFLIDAMQRMKLHDNIELTFKTGEVEQIYNVDIEPEWQFEKYAWQGTVTMTFDMDESITVGACCDNLVVGISEEEPEPIPDLYWVAENGSDLTGDGSYARPWATLGYATTQAITPGDVIHVKAGTIYETVQSVLAAGVSIIGAGETSIISSTYVGGLTMGVLQLSSPTEGSSGNQSISYLKFDGNVTGNVGIVVYRRSDVIIHHVTVENFVQEGIKYHGGSGSSDEPTIYATGNEIHNCTFNTTDDGHGAIHLNGQDGIKIYDNTFTGVQRTLGHDMNHIDMVEGYNKNIEIYDNTFTLPELLYAANGTDLLYNFHIETWDGMGGNKVYNNTFNGGHVGIDVGGHFNVKGASTFAWQIYGNTFQWSANRAYDDYGSFGGVLIEGGNEYIYVFNNHFKNIPVGINGSMIQTDLIHEYIYIYYNIFENIGFSSSGYNFALRINQGHATAITRYVYIYNNVIEGAGYCRMGIALESTGAMSYVEIRNNVIKDIVTYGAIGYWDDAGTIDNITITNNCLYNNNAERYYRNGKVVTNETYDGTNMTSDPLFVSTSDFHLQAGSPCINAGVDVRLTMDYDGQPVGNPPEIGAYEYYE